jgi:3-oxoacyl-[acyl-carrier-protein] synthase-3
MKKFSVSIKGVGSYVPDNIVTNKDLADKYGTSETWPESYLGIKERRWVDKELSSDLGYKASLVALEKASINKDEIDLLILATSTPDKIAPSTACIIADKLDIKCPAFDINAVCTGFLYGLNIAIPLIESGAYKNILLVASETYSRITDKKNRDLVYFGDGAGAVVISKSNKEGWMTTKVYSDGKGKDGFVTPIGSTFIMDGKAVFETGTTQLPIAINKLLEETKFTVDNIKCVVPHQPGIKVLEKIVEKVNIPFDKVVTVMDKYANIAAASIPIALDHAIKENRINDGDIIMLASIGSGWTWGVGLIKWENK